MAIDLHSTVKSCSRWVFGSDTLNHILGSSVFVAVIISLIMIISVMVFYPAKANTGFGIVLKMGMYMFFGTLMIMFIHDSVLKCSFEEKNIKSSNIELMRDMTQFGQNKYIYESEFQPIKPTLYQPQQYQKPQNYKGAGEYIAKEIQLNDNDNDNVISNPSYGSLHGDKSINVYENPYS